MTRIVADVEVHDQVGIDRAGHQVVDGYWDIQLVLEGIAVVPIPDRVVRMVVVIPPVPILIGASPLFFADLLFHEIPVVLLGGFDVAVPRLLLDVHQE